MNNFHSSTNVGALMDFSMVIIKLTLLSILLFSSYGVEARSRIITKDIYDCIDFYKQPAFDNSLLENHTFHPEMRPASLPTMMRPHTKLAMNATKDVQMKGKICPSGTVPIRRITKEARNRVKRLSEIYGLKHNTLSVKNTGGTQYAIVKTRTNSTKLYRGGGAGITVWNPPVESSEYSSGQLVVRNGGDSIQVGWTVTPDLYGDHDTHLFIYTSVGETRCFNTFCPAFVIVDKDFVVDEVFGEFSRSGGNIFYVPVTIYKDHSDGHWWLTVGLSFKPVGFWPKDIFEGDTATSVEWGGQAYSPPDMPSPPMGSGEILKKDEKYDAYCNQVRVVNEDYQMVDAEDIEPYVSNVHNREYQVIIEGNVGGEQGNFFYWGGPGEKPR